MGTEETGTSETVIRAGRHVDSCPPGEFAARLREVPGPGDGPVIIDLTATESIDGTTIGLIVFAFRRTEAAGRGFGIVCKPQGPVRNMLAMSGADKVMDVAASADELACRRRELPRRAGGRCQVDKAVGTVSARARAVLRPEVGDSVQLTVDLLYGKSDPYAVKVVFHVGGDGPVEWVFARDLLARGLRGSAGSGAVRICPMPRGLLGIVLVSPYGRARLEIGIRDVDDFVTAVGHLAPRGSERGTVADAIENLFLPGGMFWEERHA